MRSPFCRRIPLYLALCSCTGVDGLWDPPAAGMGGASGGTPSEQLGSAGNAAVPLAGSGGASAGGAGAGAAGSSSGVADPAPIDATLSVDVSQRFQRLDGFGAAVAWYGEWLTGHPRKSELYDLLFRELGLDILRLRNVYRDSTDNFDPVAAELLSQATTSLGHAPRVLLTSWTPPGRLKASGDTECAGEASCTLKKQNGSFVYTEFGEYWRQALHAYAGIGVTPTWISIQNEPDFIPPSWEGCRFDPTEGTYPSYGKALEAVRASLQQDQLQVGFLGPEVIGLGGEKVQSYTTSLDLDLLDVVASHLYDGQNWRIPDSYISKMRGVATDMTVKPIFQTEFSIPGGGGAFETAWLIRNSLVELGASAYLHWDLIWTGKDGLISLENPGSQGAWQTPQGYAIRDAYYSLQHFAAFTDPGDVRVAATSARDELKPVAFSSEDGRRLTLVVLNTAQSTYQLRVEVPNVAIRGAELYRTSATERGQHVGALTAGQAFALPPRSISTVVLSAP